MAENNDSFSTRCGSSSSTLKASIENTLSITLSIMAIIATFLVKERFQSNCAPTSPYCKINLGGATPVNLPAIVAFRTHQKTYLHTVPASGGEVRLSEHSHAPFVQWKISTEGSKKRLRSTVSLRSSYGTFLACSADGQGFDMLATVNERALLTMEIPQDLEASFECFNGKFIAAHKDGSLFQAEMMEVIDSLELAAQVMETVWTFETRDQDRVSLRSYHDTYLSASVPTTLSRVEQHKEFGEWGAFILDRWKPALLTVLVRGA